jgi:hypothetical protein
MKALGLLQDLVLVAVLLYVVPIPIGVFFAAGFVACHWPGGD